MFMQYECIKVEKKNELINCVNVGRFDKNIMYVSYC